ncbi:MAG: undecaprenyl-diphosphatase UppP [Patescibacteria group bacterium]|nr:undecaprenyl-diphosphatase UppP [Patescibacteria group bacterium]
MTILQAGILGVVQGLGEFLPISSSAHLVIAPWLFNWKDPGLGFDVALHWGTLLAVLVYYWQDVILIIKGFFHSLSSKTRDLQENIYQKLAWLLIIASVPGAIIGYLLEKKAETVFRNPVHIALTLAVFGMVLWAADMYGKKKKNLDRITWLDALWIGLSQAVAVIPGVSRSGSTIAAGLGLGFNREDAARFSFLMSMPIIFGAGLVSIKHFHDGVTSGELAAGFITAAIFGFLSIKYMLRYLAKHDYKIFVWYRVLAAALVIAVAFIRR